MLPVVNCFVMHCCYYPARLYRYSEACPPRINLMVMAQSPNFIIHVKNRQETAARTGLCGLWGHTARISIGRQTKSHLIYHGALLIHIGIHSK
jgi:hypothetical protein